MMYVPQSYGSWVLKDARRQKAPHTSVILSGYRSVPQIEAFQSSSSNQVCRAMHEAMEPTFCARVAEISFGILVAVATAVRIW